MPKFMANRGYAVLMPTSGAPPASAGLPECRQQGGGELMQDDITWGIQYLVDQGIADPERVAIFGGSYGGYATLAAWPLRPTFMLQGFFCRALQPHHPAELHSALLEAARTTSTSGWVTFDPEGQAQLENSRPCSRQTRSPHHCWYYRAKRPQGEKG
jgi:dienelactone hydrolase